MISRTFGYKYGGVEGGGWGGEPGNVSVHLLTLLTLRPTRLSHTFGWGGGTGNVSVHLLTFFCDCSDFGQVLGLL